MEKRRCVVFSFRKLRSFSSKMARAEESSGGRARKATSTARDVDAQQGLQSRPHAGEHGSGRWEKPHGIKSRERPCHRNFSRQPASQTPWTARGSAETEALISVISKRCDMTRRDALPTICSAGQSDGPVGHGPGGPDGPFDGLKPVNSIQDRRLNEMTSGQKVIAWFYRATRREVTTS